MSLIFTRIVKFMIFIFILYLYLRIIAYIVNAVENVKKKERML